MPDLPQPITNVVDELAAMPGAIAGESSMPLAGSHHERRRRKASSMSTPCSATWPESRARWECNEKRLIEAAGLDDIQALFGRSRPGTASAGLTRLTCLPESTGGIAVSSAASTAVDRRRDSRRC